MPTPDQERERLIARYAAMSDGELEKIARSGDQFTEVAEQILNAEIARRGLNFVLAPTTPPTPETEPQQADEPDDADVEFELSRTVTLRQFRDFPEALLAKASLESAGIRAYVIDDNMVRMDWFMSNALGGLKLQVHEEDVEAAEEILRQPIPESFQAASNEEYEQPRCPKCGSVDTSYREMLKSLLKGDDCVAWTCAACGNKWEGDSDGIPRNPKDRA